jgi:hypothetical protein
MVTSDGVSCATSPSLNENLWLRIRNDNENKFSIHFASAVSLVSGNRHLCMRSIKLWGTGNGSKCKSRKSSTCLDLMGVSDSLGTWNPKTFKQLQNHAEFHSNYSSLTSMLFHHSTFDPSIPVHDSASTSTRFHFHCITEIFSINSNCFTAFYCYVCLLSPRRKLGTIIKFTG